eukprot:scaffold132824_cov59-Cyclotella_meneghiniana.AAC.1
MAETIESLGFVGSDNENIPTYIVLCYTAYPERDKKELKKLSIRSSSSDASGQLSNKAKDYLMCFQHCGGRWKCGSGGTEVKIICGAHKTIDWGNDMFSFRDRNLKFSESFPKTGIIKMHLEGENGDGYLGHWIEMHETIQHNNFDLTRSPLKSLWVMFINYAKTTHGIMLGRSFNRTEIITERLNVRFKEEFFLFPSSRIYLMVNALNMNFIYENYAHDARKKISSLKDHFTISFVGFNSTQASYPDKFMLGNETECIKGRRETFKQMGKPVQSFFKSEL